MPVRVAAAILGAYIDCGGLLLAAAAVSTNFWRAGREAITRLFVEYRMDQHTDKLRDRLPLLRQTSAASKVVSSLGG